jgi:hypothetical protein
MLKIAGKQVSSSDKKKSIKKDLNSYNEKREKKLSF